MRLNNGIIGSGIQQQEGVVNDDHLGVPRPITHRAYVAFVKTVALAPGVLVAIPVDVRTHFRRQYETECFKVARKCAIMLHHVEEPLEFAKLVEDAQILAVFVQAVKAQVVSHPLDHRDSEALQVLLQERDILGVELLLQGFRDFRKLSYPSMVNCAKKRKLGGTRVELTEEVKALVLNTAKELRGSARRMFMARTVQAL